MTSKKGHKSNFPAHAAVISRRAPIGLIPFLLFLAGCAGTGRVSVAALDYQAIDPPAGPPAQFTQLDLDACCWWTDADGHVWVAMACERPSWLVPEWRFRFLLSLALDQPPAGRARDYRLGQKELRGVARFGPAQSRFESVRGIVALYREPGEQLRGSFRMEAAREVQQLLGGWSRASRYFMMGTFRAVHDEARGRRIAADAEALGPERPPPASSPTTQPADIGKNGT
jgi:hypothetical protein